MVRALALIALAAVLALAGAGIARAHGPEEEGVEEFAKQPAKVLVQQAHALLLNGKHGDEVMVRVEGAEESKDKTGVDPSRLEAAHNALENGNDAQATELLEQALVGGDSTSGSVAQERLHSAAKTFHPVQEGQEVAAAIAGGAVLLLALAGLAWRRSRETS